MKITDKNFNRGIAVFGCLLFLTIPPLSFLLPEQFAEWLRADSLGNTGLFEQLTVIVLIPAIVAGFVSLLFSRGGGSDGFWRAYLLLWTLALVYFAGEEASWGQWYFGWETPESWAAINDQGETNLHNTSHWLDKYPKALVEAFILIVGLILPCVRALRGLRVRWEWMVPPLSFATIVAFWLMLRMIKELGRLDIDLFLGVGELREFIVACFLACYVIWLSRKPHCHKTPQTPAH